MIDIGAVVRDRMGHEGIVLSKESDPPQDWLNEQLDPAVKNLPATVQWWGVMPFDGGYLLCAEPLLTWLREITYDDFLQAADHAGLEGRLKLAKVFPHYVDLALKKRQTAP